jgi:predicted transcriptional regulator
MAATHEIVKKIESVLSRKITEPVSLNHEHQYNRNKPTVFEQRVSHLLNNLGFSADVIQKTPFNLVAKKDRTLVVAAEENIKKIDYEEKNISSFSSVVGTPFLLVTKNESGKEHGITLKDMESMSSNQLMKKAKKK